MTNNQEPKPLPKTYYVIAIFEDGRLSRNTGFKDKRAHELFHDFAEDKTCTFAQIGEDTGEGVFVNQWARDF